MIHIRLFTIAGLLILLGKSSYAQQDAMYSQYMFNPLAINPAYAGSRNAMSGVMLYRQQWVGIDGAPQTATLALHSPIKGKNFALGLNVLTENIGPTQNGTFLGTYAYHVKLGKGKLSFGLRGGFYSTRIKYSELNYKVSTGNQGGDLRKSSANFDFGMYYHTDKFYGGFTATHIGNPKIKFNSGDALLPLVSHYMAFIGNAFAVNNNLVVKPSAMIRYIGGAPLNYDINTSVLFYRTLWVGASYRSSLSSLSEASLVFITEYNITESFRIGYSYDFNMGIIRTYSSGSHEVFLGVDIYSKRKTSVSPRLM